MNRRHFHAAIAATLSPGLAARAFAQGFPAARPVRLLIGYPPGGPSDNLGRIIAEHLARQLQQSVVVENRAGAAGAIAAAALVAQKADGYTLMIDTESVSSRAPAVYRKLPYNPLTEFSRIAKLAKQRSVLVVNRELPIGSVKALISHARAHPGQLNYGTTYGSSSHIAGALFCRLNDVSLVPVSYKGGGQLVSDLLAGVVQVGFYAESTVSSFIQAGKIRALAAIAEDRSALFPNLPTLHEAGAAPMDASAWAGLVAPKGTPAAVVERLGQAARQIVADPAFADQLRPLGATVITGSTPQSYLQETVAEGAFWKKMVADGVIDMAD